MWKVSYLYQKVHTKPLFWPYATLLKEHEKVLKYQDLCLELQQIWNLRTIKFVPTVIGVTGLFTTNLEKYLDELPGKHKLGPLLKAAIYSGFS